MAAPVDDEMTAIARCSKASHLPDEPKVIAPKCNGTTLGGGVSSVKALHLRVHRNKISQEIHLGIEFSAKHDGTPRNAHLNGKVVLMVGRRPHTNRNLDIVFILDSGAAVHVTGNYALFCSLTAVPPGISVRAANGHTLPILGRGSIIGNGFKLTDVYYVPGLTHNLVSVSKLTELDYGVEFRGAQCLVRDTRPGAGGALVGRGRRVNGIYELDGLEIPLDRSRLD